MYKVSFLFMSYNNKPLLTISDRIDVEVMLELVRDDLNNDTVEFLENKIGELENTYNNWSMPEEEFKDWVVSLKEVYDNHENKNTTIKDLVEVETRNDIEENVLDLNVHSYLNLKLNTIRETSNNERIMPFDISLQ